MVDGIKSAVSNLRDIPSNLQTNVVFDQSVFVKTAIVNLIHEGLIGLVLTGLMILIFLGNARATLAVFLSIPLSALAAFIALSLGGGSGMAASPGKSGESPRAPGDPIPPK